MQKSQQPYHSGFVAVIGRPNVGKSTLINRYVGEKVAITSNKPQTTRNKLMGVLTGDHWQIVFVDTPGIHTPRTLLGESMMNAVQESLTDIDALLIVLDATDVREADRKIVEKYAGKARCALVFNKMDQMNADKMAPLLATFQDAPVDTIFPISARTGKKTDELLELIKSWLPEGPQYFPEGMFTDRPERDIISDMIREKALRHLRDEIPHGTGVEILSIKGQGTGMVEIHANLYCERAAHKNIIIGKQGQMLKTIGSEARRDIELLLGEKVNLQLWVKVREDWRNRADDLHTLGYE